MKKALLTIFIISVIVFPALVYAAGGTKTFNVTYDGDSFTDNFTEGSFDEQIKGMEPGDNVAFTINLKNTGDEADWYVSNSVLASFEDNEKASGGAYSYRLTYKPTGGEEVELYNSETVGGESTVGGTGLHQVPEDMENYFYLDTMGKGDTAKVKMEVGLDGETQANSYQNANSSLALQFAAANKPTGNGSEGNDDDDDESGSTSKSSGAKTGDENNLLLYAFLLVAAGLALFAVTGMKLYFGAKEGSKDEK